MKQKVFSRLVVGNKDMVELESMVGSLLGGEDNKCSLIRSSDFVKLRLRALYDREEKGGSLPMHVFGEGLQISLDQGNVVSVYLLSMSVDDDVILGKKRGEPDTGRGDDLDLERVLAGGGLKPRPIPADEGL